MKRRVLLLVPGLLLVSGVREAAAKRRNEDEKPKSSAPSAKEGEGKKLTEVRVHLEMRAGFAFKKTVSDALKPVRGVKSFMTWWDDTRVVVRYDPAVCTKKEIVRAFERVGVPVLTYN